MIVYITKACVQKSDYLFVEEKILEQVLIHDLDNFWNLFLVVHNTTAYNTQTIYCSSRGISTVPWKLILLKRPLNNKNLFLFLFVEISKTFLEPLAYQWYHGTMIQLCTIGGLFVCWKVYFESCERSAKGERLGPRARIASLGLYSSARGIVGLTYWIENT